jgi:hypothetical protein
MGKAHHYHNTVGHQGQALKDHEARAYTQDQQIADFFTCHPGELYTPWEIQALVFGIPRPPITSVRRAMSNLTRDGILTKTTEKKVVGVYGHTSYAWTLNLKYYESLNAMEIVFQPEGILENKTFAEWLEEDVAPAKDVKGLVDKLRKKISDDLDNAPLEDIGGPNLEDKDPQAPEDAKKRKSENEAKNSSQGKLFDIPPIHPPESRCALCGRKLTDPESVQTEMGPVCRKKCAESVDILGPKGKRIKH